MEKGDQARVINYSSSYGQLARLSAAVPSYCLSKLAVNSSTPRPMIPPPRYKMAIITWLAIFVLIVIINLLFGSFLASLPMLLRSFVLTVVLVALMTYVVMPQMTRLLGWWLYPKKRLS